MCLQKQASCTCVCLLERSSITQVWPKEWHSGKTEKHPRICKSKKSQTTLWSNLVASHKQPNNGKLTKLQRTPEKGYGVPNPPQPTSARPVLSLVNIMIGCLPSTAFSAVNQKLHYRLQKRQPALLPSSSSFHELVLQWTIIWKIKHTEDTVNKQEFSAALEKEQWSSMRRLHHDTVLPCNKCKVTNQYLS